MNLVLFPWVWDGWGWWWRKTMWSFSLFKDQREIRLIVMMMIREEKGVKPVLLKFGLALALSFAGFIYSRLRTRRIKPSKSRKGCSFGLFLPLSNILSLLLPLCFLDGEPNVFFIFGGGIGAALSTCNAISEGNFLCSVSFFCGTSIFLIFLNLSF